MLRKERESPCTLQYVGCITITQIQSVSIMCFKVTIKIHFDLGTQIMSSNFYQFTLGRHEYCSGTKIER